MYIKSYTIISVRLGSYFFFFGIKQLFTYKVDGYKKGSSVPVFNLIIHFRLMDEINDRGNTVLPSGISRT